MTSEATLDVPTPASTTNAEPQQVATAAQNAASATADPSGDSPNRQDEDTWSLGPPTAAMESEKPQLTMPAGDPTVTEGDASATGQLSGTPSSNAVGEVSAKTSSAGSQVFTADLYSLVLSCLLLICLAW